MCVTMCLNSLQWNEGESDVKQFQVWSYKHLVQFSTLADSPSSGWSEGCKVLVDGSATRWGDLESPPLIMEDCLQNTVFNYYMYEK